MIYGSFARFNLDSERYLEKVKQRNNGTSFDQLLQRLVGDSMSFIGQLGLNSSLSYSEIYREFMNQSVMDRLRGDNSGIVVGQIHTGPTIYDLSGKRFDIYFTYKIDFSEPPPSNLILDFINRELNSVKANNIDPNNYDFLSKIFSSVSVGYTADASSNKVIFNRTFSSLPKSLNEKAIQILFSLKNHRDLIENSLRDDCAHELMHILDPSRNRDRKTYDVKSSKGYAYTDHISERHPKLNDAFSKRLRELRLDVASGNVNSILAEKAKYEKNKLLYIDSFIFKNVSANWPSSMYGREKYAPNLYSYAKKALDGFFYRAEWGNVPAAIKKIKPTLRKLFEENINEYFQQKWMFTQNGGSYIYEVVLGNGILGIGAAIPDRFLGNSDVLELFFNEFKEAFDER